MPASLIGRLGSSAFRLSTATVSNVARGLVLLFGIGTKALPSWDPRTRRSNLRGGLAVKVRQVQADLRTHLIHRPARDIIPPLGGADDHDRSHMFVLAPLQATGVVAVIATVFVVSGGYLAIAPACSFRGFVTLTTSAMAISPHYILLHAGSRP